MDFISIMENRHQVEQEILKNLEQETMKHSTAIPRPRASVSHMQWGGDEEETEEESRSLYVCSGAAGYKVTHVKMLSVACGPTPWRLPDRNAWEADFVKNIPTERSLLYDHAPLYHPFTEWTEKGGPQEYIRNYWNAESNEDLELAAPPVRQLMQIFTMAYEDLLARQDPLHGYASPWSTILC